MVEKHLDLQMSFINIRNQDGKKLMFILKVEIRKNNLRIFFVITLFAWQCNAMSIKLYYFSTIILHHNIYQVDRASWSFTLYSSV